MALKGIDISSWQSGLNIAAVPADFVIIKATQGTWMVDKTCDGFYQQCKAAGDYVVYIIMQKVATLLRKQISL